MSTLAAIFTPELAAAVALSYVAAFTAGAIVGTRRKDRHR